MTLRALLREATAARHERLEQTLALTRPSLTRSDYLTYLRSNHRVYAAIEPLLQASGALRSAVPDLARRRKLHWLEADAHRLALDDSRACAHAVDFGPQLSLGEALGCAYVLEGATLGGAYLYKHFHERWGIDPETGGRFLYGYGARTGGMWKAFVSRLDAAALDLREIESAAAAAQKTFDAIGEAFAQSGWK